MLLKTKYNTTTLFSIVGNMEVKFKRCTASKLCQGEDMHAVPTLGKTKAPLLPKPKPA